MEHGIVIKVDDRVALATGICHVVASLPRTLPDGCDGRLNGLETLSLSTLGRLERLGRMAQEGRPRVESSQILALMADEVEVLASMCRIFTDACIAVEMNGGNVSTPDRRAPMSEAVLRIIHRAWPGIAQAAANWVNNEVRKIPVRL
jgi:hypothetical protein